MSVNSDIKYLAGGNYEMIRVASELRGQTKKLISGYTEAEIGEILTSPTETNEFASAIYEKLPKALQSKIKKESFIASVLMNREKALKKKKNKKKVGKFLFS